MAAKTLTEKHSFDNDDYQHADLICDLVMKGGITSGVVYPPAITRLATKYFFRNIGGTSAGAIAAATAAAAEYGREGGGFVRLNEAQDRLKERGFMKNRLFQASKSTQPIKQTLLYLIEKQVFSQGFNVWRTIRALDKSLRSNDSGEYRKGSIIGILIGLVLVAISLLIYVGLTILAGDQPNWIPLTIVTLLLAIFLGFVSSRLGAFGFGLYDLGKRIVVDLPTNNYGVCMGHDSDPDSEEQSEQLIDWLSMQLDSIAGLEEKDRPLRFKHLHSKKIQLKMVVTDLTHGQPIVFPMEIDSIHTVYVFKASEWQALFPQYIITKMAEVMTEWALKNKIDMPDGYYLLPVLEDMPVAVAMRMSLSAPLLISAVPLYAITDTAWADFNKSKKKKFDKDEDFKRTWLSDGGICSNFPIHFFDKWLSDVPTFGINLTSYPKKKVDFSAVSAHNTLDVTPERNRRRGTSKVTSHNGTSTNASNIKDPDDDMVHLPRPTDAISPERRDFKEYDLSGFLRSIFESALNFRDNTQARLPGYRERIVQVRFSPGEGGINLAMDPETISKIEGRGELAAQMLLPNKDHPEHFNFDHHRWVRFRVLMAQLEKRLVEVEGELPKIKPLLASMRAGGFPYECDDNWCNIANSKIDTLIDLLRTWKELDQTTTDPDQQASNQRAARSDFFDDNSPEPKPVLRVTPEI